MVLSVLSFWTYGARWLELIALCLIFSTSAGRADQPAGWRIQNPYAGVDWTSWESCPASLHVHTTRSDGKLTPAQAIDAYARLDYKILALTEHDTKGPGGNRQDPDREKTTWPWSAFGRDPAALGMVAIEGNEMSAQHHLGSYFSGFGAAAAPSMDYILTEIGKRNGLAVFFHPGRYDQPAAWYAQLFRQHPCAIGLEAYSDGDSFPQDRKKWDEILSRLPERTVWGFSNDDMHKPKNKLGRNWNIFLLPELTSQAARACMENGTFFYVYAAQGHSGEPPPAVKNIVVDETNGTIAIEAGGCGPIEWISKNEALQRGPIFRLADAPATINYVRAELRSPGGSTLLGTQPFRIAPISSAGE